ncbi:MAG: bifunctional riboflavin kinase/FAD synthetase [Bacteroidota bacterium]
METIQGISKLSISKPTAVTIGTFDGVHVGHKRILERLINNAKNADMQAAVLTFFPHPRMVLQKDADIKLLNTLEEKERILAQMGLDYLIVHPFTQEFSRLTAIEFVRDMLVNKLKAKSIVIGYDHRFGRNRNASIDDLKNFGKTYDFIVDEISAQEVDDVSVSSTKIRKALLSGDVETARRYLGYTYMLSGIVVKGKGLGKTLGFPTANLRIPQSYKLVPQNGVYIVRCLVNGEKATGIMNIGTNPTVAGKGQHLEVHLFNISQDLYDTEVQVQFLKKIREEQKFASLQDLTEQLQKDKAVAMEYLNNENN